MKYKVRITERSPERELPFSWSLRVRLSEDQWASTGHTGDASSYDEAMAAAKAAAKENEMMSLVVSRSDVEFDL